MPCHHEKRVYEDHHQHILVQPRRGGPGYLAVRYASGALPHVEAVSLDSRRGITHHTLQSSDREYCLNVS